MRKTSDIPHFGSAYTLTRLFIRLVIFGIFAAFGPQGFGKTLESLLLLGILYCLVAAAIRREEPFGAALTRFDEAAAYAVVAGLAALAS
jgi:branched-subunit amino acid transport protein AzlD